MTHATTRISDRDVALVRDNAPIAEVVREHVDLQPAGGYQLKGFCPFHEEKTPSFHVNPVRSVFFCFGCQEGGDVITFARKVDNLSFTEAVQRLAARAGVELHYEPAPAVELHGDGHCPGLPTCSVCKGVITALGRDRQLSMVEDLCRTAADAVHRAAGILRVATYDPTRVGIEPCGIDTEVDLDALARQLGEVAGYLTANGTLYPVSKDAWGNPFESPF